VEDRRSPEKPKACGKTLHAVSLGGVLAGVVSEVLEAGVNLYPGQQPPTTCLPT
jgi:hypothetical protein